MIMKKYYANLLQLLLLMLFTGISYGQDLDDVNPGSRPTTVPPNAISATIEIWGAGGAGGGSQNNNRGGSGGGGGGYTTVIDITVVPGQTINYTVGTGGNGGTSNGGNGTASSLSHGPSGTNLSANGGSGGLRGNYANIPGGLGGTASGGTPTSGTQGANGGGGTGGNGGMGANGGAGGNGRSNNDGYPGNPPGGGGGGGERNNGFFGIGASDHTGGKGANGRVVITYTIVEDPTITNFTSATTICSGETVIITGTNFTGTTDVTFGGIDASSFNIDSNTQITATVPNVPSPPTVITGKIKVTNGVGDVESTGTITINTPPTAPTSITADDSTICAGSTTILTVNGGSPGTDAKIYWYSGSCGGTAIDNDVSFISVSPTTTTTYYARYEGGGCDPTGCAQVTVTVDRPTAVCKNITIQLDASGNASITAAEIDGGSTPGICIISGLSASKTAFDCTNIGPNDVTLTVTDANGNTDSCIAVVTVEDNILPNAICKAITIELDINGNASITANDIDNGSTDNCGIASISASKTDFDCTDIGTQGVILTVTDVNGNVNTCEAFVTVEGNKNITAVCTSITIQLDASGNATITPADIDGGSTTDSCGSYILTASQTTFGCEDVGVKNVTLTVTDINDSNITNSCVAEVTVQDLIPPVITCPGDVVTSTDNEQCYASGVVIGTPTATDNCSISFTFNGIRSDGLALTDNYPKDTTTITWTAIDANGNESLTCIQNITVNVIAPPVILCSADQTVYADGATCQVSSLTLDPPTVDSVTCGTIVSLDNNLSSLLPLNIGTYDVTWVATDSNGNSSSCIQKVTVVATTPVITCPSDVSVTVDAGLCTASGVNLGTPTIGDNCPVILSNDAPAIFPMGDTIVTWTATNESELTGTCTQTVTVEPILVCQNITIQLDNTGNATIVPEDLSVGSTCGSITLSASQTTFTCDDLGTNEVILTATANTFCTAIVTVIDFPSTVDLTISTSNISICQDSPKQFTATASNTGSGTLIYYWYLDTVLVQSTTSNTYTPPTGLSNGSHTVMAAIGPCTNKVESSVFNLRVYDDVPTEPTITGPTGLLCATTTTTLSVPIDPYTESYSWTVPSELQITSNIGHEIEILVDNTVITQNTYTVNLTVENPCGTKTTSFVIGINGTSANINAGPDVYLCANDKNANGRYQVRLNGNPDWVPIQFWGWNDNGAGGSYSMEGCFLSISGFCLIPDQSKTDLYTLPSGAQPGDVITITLETYLEEELAGCAAPVYDNMKIYILEDTVADITSPATTICSGETTEIVFTGVPGQQIQFRAQTLANQNIPGFPLITAIIGAGGTYTYSTPALNQPTVYHLRNVKVDPSLGLGTKCQTNYNWGDKAVTITVNKLPVITQFTYSGSPICNTSTSAVVTLNGTNAFAGGTYTSSPAGLTMNASGTINPSTSTPGVYSITYVTPNTLGCGTVTAMTNVTILESVTAVAAVSIDPNEACGIKSVQLAASALPTGVTGQWTVTAGPAGSTFSDATNPQALFTGDSNATYTLQWTISIPSTYCSSKLSDTVTFQLPDNCGEFIDFNGSDNYISLSDHYNLNTDFSIETWIKRDNNLTTPQTILSKRNANNMSTGYDLAIVGNKLRFRYNTLGSITSSQSLGNARWFHVAITRSSGTYRMYVDGIELLSVSGAAPATNDSASLIGAMGKLNSAPIEYFGGAMDEVRIWNVGLSQHQLQEMMNQEIKEGLTNNVEGTIIPMQVDGLLWTNLIGYYRMNQGSADINSGNLNANNALGVSGTLINMTTLQVESAPLPYKAINAGPWNTVNTWGNGNVQLIPNSNGVNGTPVTWNIVRTQTDITSGNRATTVLGLLVDNDKYSITNNQELNVNKYLKIDGTLKLVGESQLIQPEGSIVDYAGIGHLERDQQGTNNMFNYNYWGSPVSSGEDMNGRTYSLDPILYDGDVDQPVEWISGHNGAPGTLTTPVKLTRRWLYTYNGLPNDYNSWFRISETSEIPSGLGFIMKGGGNPTPIKEKNYTFKGQPNNGTITIEVDPDGAAVVGNPYPSAIDADQFITDNQSVLKDGGALQFWEQSPNGSTHVLKQYQGRYSYYVKTGSIPAADPPYSPSEINGPGIALKLPKRYIPVGQGFFVERNSNAGVIEFNNGQRKFVKESGGASVFLRNSENTSEEAERRSNTVENEIQRVRLAFTTPEGATRYLLLGFTPDNAATDGIDYGYDGLNGDDFPSDLSFAIAGKKFVIQGVGEFDINKRYPLDMILGINGLTEITLTELENFEEPINVYVHDALLDTYIKINEVSFQMQLEKGNYTDRFSIVFKPDETLDIIDQDFKDISVKYLQKTDEIYVKTPASIEVRQVYLVNIAGQSVRSWNMTNMNFGQEFKIPVKDIAEGNYILKVETNTNTYNKKMTIKF